MHFFYKLVTGITRLRNKAVGLIVLAFVTVGATIAFALEPATFGTWFNALYWVMTTMATVGYGDYFAATPAGKVFTIFLYIFGIGLMSLVIGKIIDSVANIHRQREAGKLKYQGSNHIVVINWSKKAMYAIEEILADSPSPGIVVIDEAERHPMTHRPDVHFISGDPSAEEVLERARIRDARAAIIFADVRIDEAALADGKSLLIASSIERIAPQVHTTVEITLEKHIQNFRHVNVNEFVLSHDAISRLAVRAALQEGNSQVLGQLLSRSYGDNIYEVPVSNEWRTYGDAFRALLSQGATLISDRGDLGINRKLDTPIPHGARLYAIADEETYRGFVGKRK